MGVAALKVKEDVCRSPLVSKNNNVLAMERYMHLLGRLLLVIVITDSYGGNRFSVFCGWEDEHFTIHGLRNETWRL